MEYFFYKKYNIAALYDYVYDLHTTFLGLMNILFQSETFH